jgi:hypothetical protein
LAPWEGSVKRCGSVTTSVRVEVAPGRGNRGDDAVGLTQILLGQKIKKKSHGRFKFYKWTVKF